MKAFTTAAAKQMPGLASSFSLSEKWTPRKNEASDERNQTGILTFGLNLAPAFPISSRTDQWHLGLVSRYSGATVPDSHGVPCPSDCDNLQDESCLSFKEQCIPKSNQLVWKEVFTKEIKLCNSLSINNIHALNTFAYRYYLTTCSPSCQSWREEMNVSFVTIKAVCARSGVQMSSWHLAGMRAATVGGFV